jgi:hypothetical protein
MSAKGFPDPFSAASAEGLPGVDSAAVVAKEVQQHQLVIAEYGMKPGLFDQRQRAKRVWTPVDEITD